MGRHIQDGGLVLALQHCSVNICGCSDGSLALLEYHFSPDGNITERARMDCCEIQTYIEDQYLQFW